MTIERVIIGNPDICPECGGEVYSRERCPDGVSWCKQGHAWKRDKKLYKERLPEPDGRMAVVKIETFYVRVPSRDRRLTK